MKKVLVIAPHPDDETLGCGGTLLKHRELGDEVSWLIVTGMFEQYGFSVDRIATRQTEIKEVADAYGFASVSSLPFPTTKLDTVALGEIIEEISAVMKRIQPEIIYLPFSGDVHTDHKVVSDAVISCTKWFRYPSVKRILCYETLSETDFGIDPNVAAFRPNVFIDISDYLASKLKIMSIYKSELGNFPFPRSEEAIRALALLRGSNIGTKYAEAFMLLKEIV